VSVDPEEGMRQIEAMKPIRVGDKVRQKGKPGWPDGPEMTVVALEDYDNVAVCQWKPERVSVSSLVRVEE
jgi:hypothetical protein